MGIHSSWQVEGPWGSSTPFASVSSMEYGMRSSAEIEEGEEFQRKMPF
jgi:hypothetical protein